MIYVYIHVYSITYYVYDQTKMNMNYIISKYFTVITTICEIRTKMIPKRECIHSVYLIAVDNDRLPYIRWYS